MAPLSSAPYEIVTRIFHSCDKFSSVLALASSCKAFHEIWLSKAPSLIWQFAPPIIADFDHALIAVRATNIVLNSSKRGELPPHPFPIKELSGSFKLPAISELREVLNIEHLAHCVEHMLYYWERTMEGNGDQPFIENIDPELVDLRSGGLFRALYHIIIAGAVCARPYNEPFFLARKNSRNEFLDHCEEKNLSENDRDYLRQFPVYNFGARAGSDTARWRDQEYKKLFGPFAEWLIENGKERGINENVPPFEVYDSAQAGGIREIKRLLGAYERLYRLMTNGSGEERFGRWEYEEKCAIKRNSLPSNIRKATVVTFSIFQVEEISMPAVVTDSTKYFLVANPCASASGQARAPDILELLSLLGRNARFENGWPPPPPQYQLFLFMLRNYFNLTLMPSAFDEDYLERGYRQDIEHGSIFNHEAYEYSQGVIEIYEVPQYD